MKNLARFRAATLLGFVTTLFNAAPLTAEVLVGWNPQGFIYVGPNRAAAPDPWFEARLDHDGRPIGVVHVADHVKLVEGLTLGGAWRSSSLNHGWGGRMNPAATYDQGEAADSGTWIQFIIAPEDGYELSLASISANVRLPSVQAGYFYRWQYAVGGGDFEDIAGVVEGSYGAVARPGDDGFALPDVDLSGTMALQNIAEPVTLRILVWMAPDYLPDSDFSWVFGRTSSDDLMARGTVRPIR